MRPQHPRSASLDDQLSEIQDMVNRSEELGEWERLGPSESKLFFPKEEFDTIKEILLDPSSPNEADETNLLLQELILSGHSAYVSSSSEEELELPRFRGQYSCLSSQLFS